MFLHGRGGEDGTIQGALELLGVPYTGSGVLGSALAMDKIKTKQIWQALGLPTAHYLTVKRETYHPSQCEALIAELGECIMVKPAQEGSSIGMSKVSSVTELKMLSPWRFNLMSMYCSSNSLQEKNTQWQC